MKELKIDAVPENLDTVLDFVNAELETMESSPKVRHHVAIAVEEIFVNIAHYAYNPEVGAACVRVSVSAASSVAELRLVFEDSGKPYNPLERADPDITASVQDKPIGGLGILMVKKIMDTVEYRYENGINQLTMTKVIQ